MSDIHRFETGPSMSQIVTHGNTVYLAGQVAESAPGGTVTEQTTAILAQTLVEAAQQRSTTCEDDAAVADVSREHWRSALEGELHCIHNLTNRFGNRFTDFDGIDLYRFWNTGDKVTSLGDH